MTELNIKIDECISKCNIFEDKMNNSKKKNYENYQNSFQDILTFEKPIKETEKKKIDYVFYNDQNNDGLMCGYVVYQYLVLDNKKEVKFRPVKPSSGNSVNHRIKEFGDELKDKILLICDVYYGVQTIKYLSQICKKVYIVDDHKITKNNSNRFSNLSNVQSFIGETHSACVYTWKFFYPKKDIPQYLIEVDNKDKKQLFLSFIDKSSQYLTSYINFNLTNNPYLNKNSPDYFDKVHQVINKSITYQKMVGHFYDEVENNIKDQVAKNAVQKKFQGHNVIVLNYNDPVLYKKVARQMITNAEKKGWKVDFAVLWGWEYTSNAYKILMSEKHEGKPKFNLPQLAQKLGREGGHFKGGGGKDFIGNFYWPHNKKHDIWDLFK